MSEDNQSLGPGTWRLPCSHDITGVRGREGDTHLTQIYKAGDFQAPRSPCNERCTPEGESPSGDSTFHDLPLRVNSEPQHASAIPIRKPICGLCSGFPVSVLVRAS